MENRPSIQNEDFPDGWVNFYRIDDWSATAYFYIDSPSTNLPPLEPVAFRVE